METDSIVVAQNNRPSALNEHAPNLLADLLVSLIQGHKLSGATREWAVIGVLAYARGEIASMDTALGLSSGGRRHLRTVMAHHTRDKYLSEALEAIAIDPAVSTWSRCQRLTTEVRRLIPVWDRQYSSKGRPGIDWPSWKQALFRAVFTTATKTE